MEELFNTVVKPFCAEGHIPYLPQNSVHEQRRLYLWATAVVSAYSFTLGEDKFQAMVSYHLCQRIGLVLGKMHAMTLHSIQNQLGVAVLEGA